MTNQTKFETEIENKFAAKTKKSYAAYIRAKSVIPSGVLSKARLLDPYPFYVKSGSGSRINDIDGNELIDCAMGYGAILLGHAHPAIADEIRKTVSRGGQFGIPHEEEYRLAKLLTDTVTCLDKVTFCNSGSEAVYQAIRIARAATGKTKIAKFEGGYHGGTNEVLANFKYDAESGGPCESPHTIVASIGIPPEAQANTLILPYNHEAAFGIIEKNKDDLAVVLVEVMQGMGGNIIGDRAFIQELTQVTSDLGIVLLVDEIITGYRLGLGGGQAYYDIEADISTFGKIIGGGLPIGAVGGKDWIMDAIAYTGEPAVDAKIKPFYGGTFNGNMLTMAAGSAALEYLKEHPEIYPQLEKKGDRLRKAVNNFCQEEELPAQMIGTGSMFCTHFTNKRIRSVRDLAEQNTKAATAFYPHLLDEGIFLPKIHMGFLSTEHRDADVERIAQGHINALKTLKQQGYFG